MFGKPIFILKFNKTIDRPLLFLYNITYLEVTYYRRTYIKASMNAYNIKDAMG